MCAAINMDNSSSKDTAGDPGLSLWLVPTEGSNIYNALAKAITQIVPPTLSVSDSPKFEPHLTLASRIPKHSITENPQKWLDGIDLPAISTVEVQFHELATGNAFFKKLFIRCARSDSLLQLAASCRAFSSANIDETQYDPHVSIL